VISRLMLVLLTLFMTMSMAAYAWASELKIIMDGVELRTAVAPYQNQGRTMVPLRVISENLAAVVDWDPVNKRVNMEQDGKTIVLTLGRNQALVDGEVYLLDVPAVSVSGRTFVPLRFISEMLGCKVDYQSGVVTIASPDDGSMAYLLQAGKAYLNAASVQYNGHLDGYVRTSTGGVVQSDEMKMHVSGWFKNPGQFYMYTNLNMSGEPQVTRMYFDGKNTYLRLGDGPWNIADDSFTQSDVDWMQLSQFAQNPVGTVQSIKQLGMRTRFADDEKINNLDCKVISYSMNNQHYTRALRLNMENIFKSEPELYQTITEEDKLMLEEYLLRLIQSLNQHVKLYFAKDSQLLVREVPNMEMTMIGPEPGDRMEIKLGGVINYADYNAAITPPDVAGAVKGLVDESYSIR